MADWVRTFVNKIDDVLKDDLNTEIAAIDATLNTIPDNAIHKTYQPFDQHLPLVHGYFEGDSPFDNLLGHQTEILWRYYTGVRYLDPNPSADKSLVVHAYVEAMMKALYKGDGKYGRLGATVCRFEPLSWTSTAVGEGLNDGSLVVEVGIIWEITIAYSLIE